MSQKLEKLSILALIIGIAVVGIPSAFAADITVSSNITVSETWTADNTYFLNGVIFVEGGATLTIEPGTVVRGLPDDQTPGASNPGTLVVSRDAKLRALGTELMPIVFTDEFDDNFGNNIPTFPYDNLATALDLTAQWGGLIMLGRGYVANNTAAGPDPARTVQIEGLLSPSDPTLSLYGGCAEIYDPADITANPSICDDGDSGTLQYVSLRYGGFELASNNEINGLTLGGVGRETDIEYFEVFQNKDDGVEFFGGAGSLKNVIVANVGDDSLDYDEGWRGKVQYLFAMQGIPGTGADKSDKGGEHDGGNSPDSSQPFAIPTIYNATYVGQGNNKAITGGGNNTGIQFRDNAGGRYYNSAVLDFAGASILIEGGSYPAGSPTGADTSGERATTAYSSILDGELYQLPDSNFQLELQNNTFWCIGRQESSDVVGLGRQLTLATTGVCTTGGGTVNPGGAACLTDAECGAGERCADSPLTFGGGGGKYEYDNGLFSNAALQNSYVACADPLPIRELVRADFTGPSSGIPDQTVSIDPRPAVGSPLNTTTRLAPNDGFFEAAPYQGAFGDTNWALGWSNLSRLGYFPSKPQVSVTANVTTSQTWSAENEYILEDVIFVENGATLTLEPGTIVRGRPDDQTPGASNPGTMVVSRDAKIQALGNQDRPVVFTDMFDSNMFCPATVNSSAPDASCGIVEFPYDNLATALDLTAQWGGLIMLGRGYVANNTAAGPDPARTVQIEGLLSPSDPTLSLYGGCAEIYDPATIAANPSICDDGDSGTLQYVSLRYGGFELASNNEINGLTLGAVGRGTEVDHFEVFQNKDDGVEFFGGAGNLKNVIVANVGDDSLDYDEGWRGKVQYLFAMQGIPGTGADKSDKGGEHDGGNSPDSSQPFAIPTIYNATYVGQGNNKAITGGGNNTGIQFRDNAGGRYYNSAVLDFAGASILIEGGSYPAGSPTGADTSGERATTAYSSILDGELYQLPDSNFQLELQNNTFWCIGRQESSDVVGLGRQLTLATTGVCTTGGGTVDPGGATCLTDAECGAGERCADSPLTFGGGGGKYEYDNGLFSSAALQNSYLACADPLPIRELVRADFTGPSSGIPDQTVSIDPRPVAGGALTVTDKAAPSDGFFEQAPFRGAFGTTNWVGNWANMSRLGYTPACQATVGPVPDEVEFLDFNVPGNKSALAWTAPVLQGLSGVQLFDLLRKEGVSSADASSFAGAIFVESADADLVATDSAEPLGGEVFFYTVRATNTCGDGTLGLWSDGTDRPAP